MLSLRSLLPRCRFFSSSSMALSRFEYVKTFEHEERLLPNCWTVVRIDGKGFHRFCDVHEFRKPNDPDGLLLMNLAAVGVMEEFNEIVLGYGQSDEYSFVFHRDASVYQRRRDKLVSYIASLFTSSYMFQWKRVFGDRKQMRYPPSFDSRAVLYPTDENIRDYLSWRQADVHVNNLYNTAFWNLVDSGLTNEQAEKRLRGTFAKDKNEILFSEFNINYNNEPAMYRKGTILLRKKVNDANGKPSKLFVPIFEDLIQDQFWLEHHPELLNNEKGKSSDVIYKLGERFDHPIVKFQLEKLSKRKLNMQKSLESNEPTGNPA